MNPSAPLWQTRLPATLRPSEKLAGLLQSPSLTSALRALPCEFSVRLLHLGLADGSLLLDGGGPDKSYFCRDVELCLNGEPVVWARSQCLPSSGYWRQMLDCG
ncbi:MAG: chorismate--pyruvate lyase family protein, partial [Neisseria elongata]